MAMVSTTLSRIWAAEAATKLPSAESTPAYSAISDIHSRYGNAMRANSTDMSNFSGVAR